MVDFYPKTFNDLSFMLTFCVTGLFMSMLFISKWLLMSSVLV